MRILLQERASKRIERSFQASYLGRETRLQGMLDDEEVQSTNCDGPNPVNLIQLRTKMAPILQRKIKAS